MKRRRYWGEGLPASFHFHFFSLYRYLDSIGLVIILFMLVFCLLCYTGSDTLCQIMLQARMDKKVGKLTLAAEQF